MLRKLHAGPNMNLTELVLFFPLKKPSTLLQTVWLTMTYN